jgi:hypothetical protein
MHAVHEIKEFFLTSNTVVYPYLEFRHSGSVHNMAFCYSTRPGLQIRILHYKNQFFEVM